VEDGWDIWALAQEKDVGLKSTLLHHGLEFLPQRAISHEEELEILKLSPSNLKRLNGKPGPLPCNEGSYLAKVNGTFVKRRRERFVSQCIESDKIDGFVHAGGGHIPPHAGVIESRPPLRGSHEMLDISS
jgi:hypothetical protein